MKTIFFRIFLVLTAIVVGIAIFMLISYAGDKSKGPFEDFLTSINLGIASMENDLVAREDRRSKDLEWFDRYRNSPAVLNTADTIFYGIYDDRSSTSFENIVRVEDSLDMHLPIISFYTAWGSKKEQQFPAIKAQAIYQLGSMPMITWEPWLDDFDPAEFPQIAQKMNNNEEGLQLISNGVFDPYIVKWALAAKKFRHPLFLRFGHEMNDPYRYPWGPHNNAPEDYIAAWKHVVTKFREVGASNVVWMWSPHIAYENAREYYPGHEYVDWIGLTTLNYGTVAPWSKWWTFDEVFEKGYNEFSQYDKPIMISEFGSLEVGGDRAQWYADALSSLPEQYPAVKALIYFHAAGDNTTTYKVLDWSFVDDEEVVEAIKSSIQK
ncbi:glycoside hydrolase family 26 protein [Salinimicrobium xinjiangense]|uniref:glycoside hydrolase family 26 protein n=1 Tax=Salinimicrobium xinjiangense TaxID=438596 RepID=UPI000423F8EE|nr:glycosyl hydrolase [Salinimicrobium xinjiangense]